MAIDVEKIKKLREETGAGVLEIKSALEETADDYDKAKEILMRKVASKAAKKADRTANDGLVYSYIHNGGKVGSMILVSCETDFVAKTEDFKKLCHEVAMQVCTEELNNVEDLLEAEYIRDPSKKIIDLVNEAIAKLGEKIEIVKFVKFSVGE
ncbi:translation elongation factor Ts [candidate division WWE3 bacterium]|uniref:Elongation factor Ts n=1 Tax=candidate division WWE3 bacterium TaxID=2053526 RepID=A0A7X9E7G5_UNCKA|nr:translation elongation factor Ts [candidate division WWE3 bacterium]